MSNGKEAISPHRIRTFGLARAGLEDRMEARKVKAERRKSGNSRTQKADEATFIYVALFCVRAFK